MTINLSILIMLIIMTMFFALGSLFLKRASGFKNIKEIFLNQNLYIGGILYVTGAFLNVYLLQFIDYSIILPLTSITYIWTMILSYMILKEKVGVNKIIGVFGILLGCVLLIL